MHSFANRLEAENRLEEAIEDDLVRELEEWEGTPRRARR